MSGAKGSDRIALDEALDAIGVGVRLFFDSRPKGELQAAEYESALACFGLGHMVGSLVDSVRTLGLDGVENVLGATVIARAAFEAAATVAWMLTPDDPISREARWLSYTADDTRQMRALAKDLPTTDDAARFLARATALEERHHAIAELLQAKGLSLAPLPDLRSRMHTLGFPDLYSAYRVSSEIVHGRTGALNYVRETSDGRVVRAPPRNWLLGNCNSNELVEPSRFSTEGDRGGRRYGNRPAVPRAAITRQRRCESPRRLKLA